MYFSDSPALLKKMAYIHICIQYAPPGKGVIFARICTKHSCAG